MFKFNEQLTTTTETNAKGDIKLFLSDLAEFDVRNPKLRMFSLAQLKPGEEVEYHQHDGECEYYYILSGSGIYNDNGKEITVVPKMITATPSGTSHGIKNTGKDMLEFIALIIKD